MWKKLNSQKPWNASPPAARNARAKKIRIKKEDRGYHEAGHALVAAMTRAPTAVH